DKNQSDEQGGGIDGENDVPGFARGALRNDGDERAGERTDRLNELPEGKIASILAFWRDIAHDRIAGNLKRGGACAEQENRDEEDRKGGEAHSGGNQHTGEHDEKT